MPANNIKSKNDIRNIVFYNKGHIGDLHLTRHYVKRLAELFPCCDFYYLHAYGPSVIPDTSTIYMHDKAMLDDLPHHQGIVVDLRGTYFINTWVYSLGNVAWCTFQSGDYVMHNYYEFLKRNALKEVPPPENLGKLIPKIDFEKCYFDKSNIDEHFRGELRNSIFLCNNYTRNNQSYNDNLNFFAIRLADTLQIPIYLTNRIEPRLNHKNIFYAEDIIGIEGFSLNALSYFSTFCPVIIGRGSGPFTFCEIEENVHKLWFSMTFPHVSCDAFNGLYNFSNKQVQHYFQTQDEDLIVKTIEDAL